MTWLPHGRAFRVNVPIWFEQNISEKYFGNKRYSSFLRQLSNHNFKQITKGPDRNSYYHELFLRGLPHLIKYMAPPKDARRLIPDPDNEPNFYAISKQFPVPGCQDFGKKNVGESSNSDLYAARGSRIRDPTGAGLASFPTHPHGLAPVGQPPQATLLSSSSLINSTLLGMSPTPTIPVTGLAASLTSTAPSSDLSATSNSARLLVAHLQNMHRSNDPLLNAMTMPTAMPVSSSIYCGGGDGLARLQQQLILERLFAKKLLSPLPPLNQQQVVSALHSVIPTTFQSTPQPSVDVLKTEAAKNPHGRKNRQVNKRAY